MPNPTIAELISARLAGGLQHPGYPETEQPSVTIRLPLFKTAGMPPEVYQQVTETVKMLGEAIVYTIETEGESVIIGRDELQALRTELAQLKEDQP